VSPSTSSKGIIIYLFLYWNRKIAVSKFFNLKPSFSFVFNS
jgi:hypothetical protein